MSRVARAVAEVKHRGLDAFVISAPSNIRYLSGFSGSSGTMVLRNDAAMLLTDGRYTERARDEIDAADADVEIVRVSGNGRAELLRLLDGASRVGIEADHTSWSAASSPGEDLGGDTLVATIGLVEAFREIKDDVELGLMRRAAEFADRALAQLLTEFVPGVSERDVARRLDALVLDAGADGSGFDTIVGSGPNSSRPHHQSTNRTIEMGDLVIIDFGAECSGYRSDMTRTFVFGEPSARQRELLDAVHDAQAAGVAAVGVGVAAQTIDAACRSHLSAAGLAEWFTHGTGHGVGLDIHEAPSVSAKGTATLAAGHVITVEPGVYLPEFGGVRWEDTVVVTSTGADPLTRSPKQPVII